MAWDGTARFGTDSRAVDITGTVDGALLIFGLPWNGDLAGFMDLIAESATRFHGCAAVDDASPFEVNGVAGLSQHEVCAQNTPVLSTVLVNGGHALAIRVMVNADKVDVIFDHVVTWLSGLTWEGS
ncbi:MAG TPA: hypothetical protein VFX65_01125 [Candidatus Limnocylindrales bacterium]|nr:hypothetical protein [Candidatus Limnocylindrales bacterium]